MLFSDSRSEPTFFIVGGRGGTTDQAKSPGSWVVLQIRFSNRKLLLRAVFGDFGLPGVKVPQVGQALQVIETCVGDRRSVQVKVCQILQVLEAGESLVGDLGFLQVQLRELGQALDGRQARVRNRSLSQIQMNQVGDVTPWRQVGIGD